MTSKAIRKKAGVLNDMAVGKIARPLIERAEAVSQADTPTLQTGATHAG
jgi:hypothetical protein